MYLQSGHCVREFLCRLQLSHALRYFIKELCALSYAVIDGLKERIFHCLEGRHEYLPHLLRAAVCCDLLKTQLRRQALSQATRKRWQFI